MIYTCTLNPAIDYILQSETFRQGKLNRIDDARFTAGGKGINVSIVLKELGTQNKTTGFIGGFTGHFIESHLKRHFGLNLNFVPVNDNTRVNVKLKHFQSETEINPQGPMISDDEFDELTKLIQTLKKEDTLICGGSICRGQPNAYEKIAEICHRNQVPFVMDTPGIYFNQYIKYKPFLMKPNVVELEEYFQKKIETIEQVIYYGKKLIEEGAQHVMISLGAKGSLFIGENITYRSNIIKGEVKNTVGSGDSMVAAFMHQYQQTKDLKIAYKYAIAAGTATAFSNDLAQKHEIEKYLNVIKIKEISHENS